MDILKTIKKYRIHLNLTFPLIIFIATFFLGINPIRPIIIAVIMILNIIVAESMGEYVNDCVTLMLATIVGSALMMALYYYLISSDPETPIVGVFICITYFIMVAMVGLIGAVIVAIRKKFSKKQEQ